MDYQDSLNADISLILDGWDWQRMRRENKGPWVGMGEFLSTCSDKEIGQLIIIDAEQRAGNSVDGWLEKAAGPVVNRLLAYQSQRQAVEDKKQAELDEQRRRELTAELTDTLPKIAAALNVVVSDMIVAAGFDAGSTGEDIENFSALNDLLTPAYLSVNGEDKAAALLGNEAMLKKHGLVFDVARQRVHFDNGSGGRDSKMDMGDYQSGIVTAMTQEEGSSTVVVEVEGRKLGPLYFRDSDPRMVGCQVGKPFSVPGEEQDKSLNPLRMTTAQRLLAACAKAREHAPGFVTVDTDVIEQYISKLK